MTYTSRAGGGVSVCELRETTVGQGACGNGGAEVVKGPSGSVTEHIESSKSSAGGSGDCTISQQELPLRLNPL